MTIAIVVKKKPLTLAVVYSSANAIVIPECLQTTSYCVQKMFANKVSFLDINIHVSNL